VTSVTYSTKFIEREIERIRLQRALIPQLSYLNPVWSMLLELYLSETKQLRTQTTYLVSQSGAPHATGIRWINFLVKSGLITREEVIENRRSRFVVLTTAGTILVERYLAMLSEGSGSSDVSQAFTS